MEKMKAKIQADQGAKVIQDLAEFTVWRDPDGTYRGVEKPHVVFTGDDRVFVQEWTSDLGGDVANGMEKVNAGEFIEKGTPVAIKVNLGGGIHGVLPTYTDPDLVAAVASFVLEHGGKPFVCEANMRGHRITRRFLQTRGYLPLLEEMGVPFVNLSEDTPQVSMRCLGIPMEIQMPLILLEHGTRIFNIAPPKHHWECGITCAQKNMYGAIGDYNKSKFHRMYDLIDHVVAAAARVMKPDLNIIGTRQLGAGLGPHFAIPFNFHRLVFARDMLACDHFCAELLGYPPRLVKYLQINKQGKDIRYRMFPGSAKIHPRTLRKIRQNRIPPATVELHKKTLFIQYFVPSWLQFHVYHHFEWLLTWMNHAFYSPRGDPGEPSRRR